MCLFKRIIWACGCPRGEVRDRPCEARGTPECRRRYSLDRIRVHMRCRNHLALTLSPLRPHNLNTTPRNQRTPLILISVDRSGSSATTISSLTNSSPNTLFSPLSARSNGFAFTNGNFRHHDDDQEDENNVITLNTRVRANGSPTPRLVNFLNVPGARIFNAHDGETTGSDDGLRGSATNGNRNFFANLGHGNGAGTINTGTGIQGYLHATNFHYDDGDPNNGYVTDDFTVTDPSIYDHSQRDDDGTVETALPGNTTALDDTAMADNDNTEGESESSISAHSDVGEPAPVNTTGLELSAMSTDSEADAETDDGISVRSDLGERASSSAAGLDMTIGDEFDNPNDYISVRGDLGESATNPTTTAVAAGDEFDNAVDYISVRGDLNDRATPVGHLVFTGTDDGISVRGDINAPLPNNIPANAPTDTGMSTRTRRMSIPNADGADNANNANSLNKGSTAVVNSSARLSGTTLLGSTGSVGLEEMEEMEEMAIDLEFESGFEGDVDSSSAYSSEEEEMSDGEGSDAEENDGSVEGMDVVDDVDSDDIVQSIEVENELDFAEMDVDGEEVEGGEGVEGMDGLVEEDAEL